MGLSVPLCPCGGSRLPADLELAEAALQAVRIAGEVKTSENHHLIVVDLEEDTVRIPTHERTARFVGHDWKAERVVP